MKVNRQTKILIDGDLAIAKDGFARGQFGETLTMLGLAVKRFGEEIKLEEKGGEPEPEDLTVPTVHLNGTSKQGLIDQILEAGSAVREAVEKLNAAWPNGRDYYVKGESEFAKADAEWNDRRRRLLSVTEELAGIIEKIDEQGD